MKTIFAFSDLHNLPFPDKLIPVMECCDYVVFLGDGLNRVTALKEKLGDKFYAVSGNCDRASNPEKVIIEAEGRRILCTHGHLEGVKRDLLSLAYEAKEVGATCVLYGHTHLFGNEICDGVTLINVGSLGNSFCGDNGYAFISVDKQNIFAKFVKIV